MEDDEIRIHFDKENGRLSLNCGDATFDRLRDMVCAEAFAGEEVLGSNPNILVIEIEPRSTNTADGHHGISGIMLQIGCGALGLLCVITFAVGAFVIAEWLWGAVKWALRQIA